MQHRDKPNLCLRLDIEYDGSRYSGWQEQQNARTIAGEIRYAAENILRAHVDLGGAGRTDAGVHARGQVAHLKWAGRQKPDVEQFLAQLNHALPADVVVSRAKYLPLSFHARHEATGRTYVYQIARRKTAFHKKFVWWIKEPLDLQLMSEGARRMMGRHDFRSFQAMDDQREKESSIVVVERALFEETPDQLLFTIEASHFVWRMVRRVTGVLVRLGVGEIGLDEVDYLLEGKKAPHLDVAAWTAPSSGLFLESVRYPSKFC